MEIGRYREDAKVGWWEDGHVTTKQWCGGMNMVHGEYEAMVIGQNGRYIYNYNCRTGDRCFVQSFQGITRESRRFQWDGSNRTEKTERVWESKVEGKDNTDK